MDTKAKLEAAGDHSIIPEKPLPPSVILKKYFKEMSTNPSVNELKRLAVEVMGHEGDVPILEEWFARQRMKAFEKDEELKESARQIDLGNVDESNVLEVVDRVVFLCVGKVAGLVRQAKCKANYVRLLSDARVGMSPRGTMMELVDRLYQQRTFLLSMFQLDPLEVYPLSTGQRSAHAEVDDIECKVCHEKTYSSENPIILCDGEHNGEDCGYHIQCLAPPLDHVPEGDWLCPECVAAGHLIMIGVIGKRSHANRVYYLVVWQGQDEPTWQAYQDIPVGSRDVVNEYNRRDKSRAKNK